MSISTGVVLPYQAERGRGCTQQLPGVHRPLCLPYLHTYIYPWNYIYLSWIALQAPCLHREELAPCSTNALQGNFHSSLGLSFIVSSTHRMKCPQLWVAWIRRGHGNTNLWMQHTSLRVLPTRPAQLCPGSKRDPVNNSLALAQLLGFSSPKPGFSTRDGEVHLCSPPRAAPGDAAAKNKPQLRVLSLMSFQHLGSLARAAAHPPVLGAQTLIILPGRQGDAGPDT